MAKAAYQKASQRDLLWMLIGFAGVVAQLATMFFLAKTPLGERMGVWVFVIGAVPFLGALIFGALLLRRLNRERIGSLVSPLEAAGFRVIVQPEATVRTEFAAPLIHLFPWLGALGLVTGADGIKWCATRGDGAGALRLFEHEFTTGSGKTTNIHYHTVVAWPAGHAELSDAGLATAPWFTMARHAWLMRRALRAHELKDPRLAAWAEDWFMRGDAATGLRFLTPEAQARLRESPRGELWSIGAGWVCCVIAGGLTAEYLTRFLAHARGAVAAPPTPKT